MALVLGHDGYLSPSVAKEDTASCSGCRRGQHSPQQTTKTTSYSFCELCGTESRLNQQQKLRSSEESRGLTTELPRKEQGTLLASELPGKTAIRGVCFPSRGQTSSQARPVLCRAAPARPHPLAVSPTAQSAECRFHRFFFTLIPH